MGDNIFCHINCDRKYMGGPCQVPIRFAILAVKRCISAVVFGRMVGVLTSIDRSSSTFLFSAQQHDFLLTDSYESGYTDLARGVGLSIRRCNTVSGRGSRILGRTH